MSKSFTVLIYIAIMAIVTYLIRVVPFTLFRKKIKSKFLRAFLDYIPYAVLASMTIPYVFYEGKNPICGAVGFAVAVILAFFKRSLIEVALAACVATFLCGMFF